MIAYILRRLALLPSIMVVVGTVTFLLIHITPGDPAAIMLGSEATPEQVARLRQQLGLDNPLLAQYVDWVSDVVRLDFGESLFLDQSVSTAIRERLVPTLQLTLYSLVVAIVISIPTGVVAALRRNSLIDRALMLFALAGSAVADYFLGILLILIFAVTLRWLPSGGYIGFRDDAIGHLESMLLPTLALGISIAGLPARMIRSTMLDVLQEDYIRTALAKGLAPGTIAIVHALRNALLPAVTVFGATIGDLLGGAIVVETVFGLPGLGQLVISSIARRDVPVIQGVVMVSASAYLLANLLTDLVYAALDPRVRHVKR